MALAARVALVVGLSALFTGCQTVTEEPKENPTGPGSPAITVPLVITTVATPIPAVSPTPGPTPTPTPGPTPTPNATPTPPPVSSNCRPGGGSGGSDQCRREGVQYLDAMTAAIDQVVAENPQMFDVNDKKDVKAYKVLQPTAYHDKVAAALRQMGYCATIDNYEEIGIKEDNSFAESYDILTSSNYIWRGLGSYQTTCRPPWF